MNAGALDLLVAASLSTSAAILVVALIRKPLRRLSGPQAACWVWLLVPACTLAVFLPMPSPAAQIANQLAAGTFALPLPGSTVVTASNHVAVALAIWLAGCATMVAFMAYRQRKFVRSLGDMTCQPDGTYRSAAVRGPVLLGILRARIVVPMDFDVRYDVRERALMLAHELAHRERGDILVGAVATLWLCVFWFNPLLYWAVSRLRFDQELACDSMVLSTLHAGRRRYARTLLKAQLAADSPWRIPVGCHWLSAHPLQERIAMLKRPSPGSARRSLGIFLASALIVAGSAIVWACTPTPLHLDASRQNDLQFRFEADEITQQQASGEVTFRGNVLMLPTDPGTSQLSYVSDRMIRNADAVLLEGAVRFSFDGHVLTTDRARVDKDGVVHMDSAVMSPVR